MKHKLTKIILILATVLGAFSVFSTPVFADENFDDSNCNQPFLGLTSWCFGIGNFEGEEELKTGIWKIAANIAIDITVIAAYLVLGFVIYGGYLYSLSGGDPHKVATGRKTLANAFIGLAIVLTAYIILNTIRFVLIGSDGNLSDRAALENINVNLMVTSSIQWVVGIAGLIAAIFIIIGGISYMTSAGDSQKAQKARQTILYALIGLAIVALAEIITAFVTNMINDAKAENSYHITNQTVISKEVHENKTI